jgi:uncharacterized protein YjeT (DUF2065 family)
MDVDRNGTRSRSNCALVRSATAAECTPLEPTNRERWVEFLWTRAGAFGDTVAAPDAVLREDIGARVPGVVYLAPLMHVCLPGFDRNRHWAAQALLAAPEGALRLLWVASVVIGSGVLAARWL